MLSRDYPYMYARISAKKAKLLKEKDYENFWKMEANGIARSLGERDYKEDIDDLGSEHEGVELVELALMRNVSRTMNHIVKISPERMEPILRRYLRRYDILSIKRLLRWKKGNQENNIQSFLVPVGDYSFEELEELSEKSFEEILESIEFPESDIDYKAAIEGENDLRKIERNLDRAYYREIKDLKGKVGGIWFKKFIEREIDYENLQIALRLKKQDLEPEEIREWLVDEDTTKIVEQVINAETIDEAVELVKNSKKTGAISGETLEEISHSLEVDRLNKAFTSLHIEPLSATAVFGYIVAKMTEVKNLRMMIRAKDTGIENPEKVKENLVIK